MKDISPVKRIKISDEVTNSLEKMIIDNNMVAGDKLPSQAELSNKLQVGSRSIREAVRSLESRGMVETRQGIGVFVKNNNLDYFLETLMGSFVFNFPNQKDLLIDLTKTRLIIESKVIYDVAMAPPEGFISNFTRIINELDNKASENNIQMYNMLDIELHKSIIEATGNKIIISLYKYLTDILVKCFSETGYIQGSLETSIEDHHKLLDAVTSKNPVLAQQIMERHLGVTLKKVEKLFT